MLDPSPVRCRKCISSVDPKVPHRAYVNLPVPRSGVGSVLYRSATSSQPPRVLPFRCRLSLPALPICGSFCLPPPLPCLSPDFLFSPHPARNSPGRPHRWQRVNSVGCRSTDPVWRTSTRRAQHVLKEQTPDYSACTPLNHARPSLPDATHWNRYQLASCVQYRLFF